MTEHDTRVLHDNVAACRCGWRAACRTATEAARACWDHVKTMRPRTESTG